MLKRREVFIPNCEKDLDTGTWTCEPIIRREGEPEIKSEEPIVLAPKNGNFEIIKGRGAPEELIDRLERHFQKHKLIR